MIAIEKLVVFSVYFSADCLENLHWYIMFTINRENDLVPEYRIIERVFIVFLLSSLPFKKA